MVVACGSVCFQHGWWNNLRAGGGRRHSGAPGVEAGPPRGWS